MADQAPPENANSSTFELPAKLRVHALAKLLGLTSKAVLARLADLGVPVRGVQSSVTREVAEQVVSAIDAEAAAAETADAPTADAPTADAPTADAPTADAPTADAVAPEVERSGPVDTNTAEARAATFSAPTVAEPTVDTDTSAARTATFSAPTVSEPTVESGRALEAVQPPLFLQPDRAKAPDRRDGSSAEASDEPAGQETGRARNPRRRRSRKSSAAAADTSGAESPPEPPQDESADDNVAAQAALSDGAPVAASEASRAAESDKTTASAADTSAADTSAIDTDDTDSEGSEDDQSPRRRRRGRRGRGRGRGEQAFGQDGDSETDGDEDQGDGVDQDGDSAVTVGAVDADGAQAAVAVEPHADASDADGAESDDSEDGEGGQDEANADGSSRRRRRRRRRKAGTGDGGEATTAALAPDDPPNTVVHEREPRNKGRAKDEVQGIAGSTRLEAKRQRRRDGRDAGRRRPPILTESEFLARRESVDRVMVVRERGPIANQPAYTQVAVLEDGILVEHFVTSAASASIVGNIYLGRVQNVLPSMEAAFIDIGCGRNGVLYAGEVNWDAAGLGGSSRKIEQALRPGDQVLVQVSKDPVGHKGARLTTQISLAGRFLVYVPGGSSTGISRKLPDTERKRLKEILRDIVPSDAGVIIRTASEGVSEEEIARDVTRLQSQWEAIESRSSDAAAGKNNNPQTLYEEPDLLVKVVRDLFNEDFSTLVIEGDSSWQTIETYIRTVAPDLLPRVQRHVRENGSSDVFVVHRIDEQLAKAMDRKVWLPSGGTLVIDRTEAMTVVDVNTGKFTGAGGNLEETVTRNNLEAAEEIVRQMRLRDIGGMIVVDFIDMVLEANRDLVLRRLTEALGRDRTRHQVSEVTSLGLVQMTRKKLGTGLIEAFSSTCSHCGGRGIVVHTEPISLDSGDGGGQQKSATRTEGNAGPRRNRRGRDRASDEQESKVGSGSDESEPTAVTPPVDPSIKRAHPAALAMAGHAQDHHPSEAAPTPAVDGAVGAGAESASTAEVAGVGSAKSDLQPVGADARPAGTEPAASTEQAATPGADAEREGAEVEREGAEADTSEMEVAAVDADEPELDGAADAPVRGRRRSRRASRSAGAAAVSSPAELRSGVVVIPVTPEPSADHAFTGSSASTQGTAQEPARQVRARSRPRRAAARPAGPPVDVDA